MKKDNQSDIDKFISDAHDILKQKFNLDLKKVLSDTKRPVSERYKELISKVEESVSRSTGQSVSNLEGQLYDSSSLPGAVPLNFSKLLWLDENTAEQWAGTTGDSIQSIVQTASSLVGALDGDLISNQNQSVLADVLAKGGILAVGAGSIITGGLTMMNTLVGLVALNGAAITSGIITAAIPAISPTVAATIASSVVAGGGSFTATSGLTATISCMAAFMTTPLGLGIAIVAVSTAIIVLAFWLASFPVSLNGIVINNSDSPLIANGYGFTNNGIYIKEGEMSYFPAVYTQDNPPAYSYSGVPARSLVPGSLGYAVPVGIFVSDNLNHKITQGACGFFTFSWGNNAPVICFFSNRKTTFLTGVYIDALDTNSGKTAEQIYDQYYAVRGLGNSGVYPGSYLTSAVNSSTGHDAYAIYCINNSNVV